ncbi:MAG: hypothetical protein PHS14_19920 [Elusimicrobia bacterium]|nr:hypothetical protein [Elusimicrobiota bacterium]
MTEITVKFNLTFSRRFLITGAAAAMMLCGVPELDSESVTLSTYYPAPSGVYTNMITTGNTYLARDGGAGTRVGIGTTAPNAKLHVAGDVQSDHLKFPGVGGNSGVAADYYGIYQEAGAWSAPYPDLRVQYHTGISYDAYYGYGGHRFFTGYDGTGNPTGAGPVTGGGPTLQITDAVTSGVPIVYSGPVCTMTPYGLGVQNCPVNQYVTFTSGIMVKQTSSVGSTDPGGTMLCCPCPVGGCPNL